MLLISSQYFAGLALLWGSSQARESHYYPRNLPRQLVKPPAMVTGATYVNGSFSSNVTVAVAPFANTTTVSTGEPLTTLTVSTTSFVTIISCAANVTILLNYGIIQRLIHDDATSNSCYVCTISSLNNPNTICIVCLTLFQPRRSCRPLPYLVTDTSMASVAVYMAIGVFTSIVTDTVNAGTLTQTVMAVVTPTVVSVYTVEIPNEMCVCTMTTTATACAVKPTNSLKRSSHWS
ncbi:hypothetical protein F5Y16DRAFT_394051 [Xylariaceae sp. FL0255]|nr:hypothetical protein F5Y16DRAFT_394051 [Xylariaceae sp. FL0255]